MIYIFFSTRLILNQLRKILFFSSCQNVKIILSRFKSLENLLDFYQRNKRIILHCEKKV